MPSQSTSSGRRMFSWSTFQLPSHLSLSSPLPTWAPHLVLLLATIPTARASSSGDDFSNNLFTDLAPLLALFGDSIVKQYLSQSTQQLDHIIFACGPLGIITGVISAIRVAGATQLMAIIGRARESRAESETELMSSTSEEVCELWNGHCIVRLLGAPDVLEVMYDPDAHTASQCGVYTLADMAAVVRPRRRVPGMFQPRYSTEEDLPLRGASKAAPNISLNTTGQHSARWETRCVAVVGVVLQLGVVVYEGVITYTLRWAKGDQAVVGYAFPLTAVGTVAISVGMFVCAYVIEASTQEVEYEVGYAGKALQVLWLQRRQSVSDQQFASYAVYARSGIRRMRTSRPQVGDARRPEGLTSLAVVCSIVGFVLQFIGLRAMHYSASIASLIIGAAMTILRTILRRGLTLKPAVSLAPSATAYTVRPMPSGHELDSVAKEIKSCTHWSVLTHITPGHTTDAGVCKATDVWRARMRLAELAGPQWEGELQVAVTRLTETIQAVADHLWNPLGGITTDARARMLRTMEWHVLVSVCARGEVERGRVEMRLAKVDADGRGPWLAKREEIAAVLCLWMAGLDEQEQGGVRYSRGNLWIVGSSGDDSDIGRGLADWWISRQSCRVEVETERGVLGAAGEMYTVDRNRILECAVAKDNSATTEIQAAFPDTGIRSRPAFQTATPAVQMATQYLLSVFLSFAVPWIEPIDSPTEIKPVDDQRVLAITNDTVSGLADIVQRLLLVTREDAHRIVVPALARAKKLPPISIRLLEHAESGERDWPFHGIVKDATYDHRATEFYRLLQSTCCGEINCLLGQKRWNDVGEVLDRLEAIFVRILGLKNARTLSVGETRHDLCAKIIALDNTDEATDSAPMAPPSGCAWPLHAAVRSGSPARVYNALRLPLTDINLHDDSGVPPLHLAALQGTPSIIRLLLLHGAHPNSEDRTRATTALHLSIGRTDSTWTMSRADTADLLLRNGAAVNARDSNGDTALTLAARQGFTPCAILLGHYGAAINPQNNAGDSAVHLATTGGHAAFVQHLIANHADLNTANNAGATPLLIAAQLAHGDIAKQLLDAGAQIDPILAAGRGFDVVLQLLLTSGDVRPEDINAGLLAAASTGYVHVVRVLLQHEAAVDTRDSDGHTALILAAAGGHVEVVQVLLENGADVHAVGEQRVTALLAVSPENTVLLEMLLRAGADVDAQDRYGSSALHQAALGGHQRAVQVLVGHGADVGAVTDDGSTSLHCAASSGSAGVTGVLLGSRPDLDAMDENGDTPLLVAVQGRHLEVVELLVDGGADVGATNVEGVTAMGWAESNRDEAVKAVLLRRGAAGSGVENTLV